MSLTVERHAEIHREILMSEKLASYAIVATRGKTASEVAAEVSARAMEALKRKEAAQPCTP